MRLTRYSVFPCSLSECGLNYAPSKVIDGRPDQQRLDLAINRMLHH